MCIYRNWHDHNYIKYLTDYKHMFATILYINADVSTKITNPHKDAMKLSEWAVLIG